MDSVNFEKLCRVCLRESDFVTPMFGTVFKSDIPDKLAYCTGLKINSEDGKPSLIYQSCIDNLHISYTFKKTCLKSDRQILKLLYGIKHDAKVNDKRINVDVKPKEIEFEVNIKEEIEEKLSYDNFDDNEVLVYDNDVNEKNDYNRISYDDNQNENYEENKVDINVDTSTVELEGACDDDDDFNWQDDKQFLSVLATKNTKKHSRKKDKEPRKKYKQKVGDGIKKTTKKQSLKETIAQKQDENVPQKKKRKRYRIPKCRYCECCDRYFPSQAVRDKHALDVHGGFTTNVICEICGKMYRRDALVVHLRTHFPPQYCCKESGCAYKAGNKGDLVKHNETHVGGEKRRTWSCKQCPKVYATSSSLCAHVQRMHEHRLNYACSYCGKRMFSKQKVIIHERIHTDEKPYPCEHCPSKFARRDQWKLHLEKSHGLVPPRAKFGSKRNRIVEIDQLKDAGKLLALDKTDEIVYKSDGNLDKTNESLDKSDENLDKTNDSKNKSCSNGNKTNENLVKSNDLMNKTNYGVDTNNDLLGHSSGFTINNIVQGKEFGAKINGAD